MSRSDRARWLLSGIGQAMITAGVVLLMFVVYELKLTNLYTDEQQRDLGRALDKTWSAPAPKSVLPAFRSGDGIARIYLPALGKKQVHVVVEGVGREDLKKGPGHYPGTELPGELGNMVISGHRTTYGAPFNRLDELAPGDQLVLTVDGVELGYVVSGTQVVKPTEVSVLEDRGDDRVTLTTCHPKHSARTRLIITAVRITAASAGSYAS